MRHLSLFTLFALLTIWAGLAFGSRYNTTINNFETINNSTTINESDDGGRAASAAMSQCHPSVSVIKTQHCIGVGYDYNTDNTAVTYGTAKVGKAGSHKVMYNWSGTAENHKKAVVGFGINF
jgi:hypothetical protein